MSEGRELYEYPVTVLTPTYNRQELLYRAFEKLCEQTCQDFQWLVIDDGSTDGTEQMFRALPEHKFAVEYHKKENGGKHTALNYAHPYIRGELIIFLDSDDYLLPDAVETVAREWPQWREDERICGMCYQKQFPNGIWLSPAAKEETVVSDELHFQRGGDRCDVYRTDVIRSHPFPVFEGEKFMSEGWLFRHMTYDGYRTVYRDKALQVCEYLAGGLSALGRPLRLRCPYGMMENCRSLFHEGISAKTKIKTMWLYWVYGKCARMSWSEIVRTSGKGFAMVLNAPFGLAMYHYWKWKFLRP